MSIKSKISKMSIALLSGAAIGAAMITTSGSASADEIYTVNLAIHSQKLVTHLA